MKNPEIPPETDVRPHCVDTSAHSLLPAIDWNAACARLRVQQCRDMAARAATFTGAERYVSENETQGLRKEILEVIRSAEGEMTGRDILRRMNMKISAKERDDVLSTLSEAGYIKIVERRPDGGGRPSKSYKAN